MWTISQHTFSLSSLRTRTPLPPIGTRFASFCLPVPFLVFPPNKWACHRILDLALQTLIGAGDPTYLSIQTKCFLLICLLIVHTLKPHPNGLRFYGTLMFLNDSQVQIFLHPFHIICKISVRGCFEGVTRSHAHLGRRHCTRPAPSEICSSRDASSLWGAAAGTACLYCTFVLFVLPFAFFLSETISQCFFCTPQHQWLITNVSHSLKFQDECQCYIWPILVFHSCLLSVNSPTSRGGGPDTFSRGFFRGCMGSFQGFITDRSCHPSSCLGSLFDQKCHVFSPAGGFRGGWEVFRDSCLTVVVRSPLPREGSNNTF